MSEEIFQKVKKAILKNKKSALYNKSSENVTLEFEGLTYNITKAKDESIVFQALGLDLILQKDDSILLLELEEGQTKIYELSEGDVKETLYSFLEWRINALDKISI